MAGGGAVGVFAAVDALGTVDGLASLVGAFDLAVHGFASGSARGVVRTFTH